MEHAYTTEHATARLQQRGIPRPLVALLIEFGQEWHDGHGARVIRFTRRSRAQLRKELGTKAYARWESHLNLYAVLSSDNGLITVGHRLRRKFRRH